MARASWLADVLSDVGLKVIPITGWQVRGGNDLVPKGVIWHHTVTRPSSSDSSVDAMLATKGSSTVPPPLANYSTNRDGSVSIIAAGTANHAGKGEWQGFTGSKYFLGDEMKNFGSGDPKSQYYEPWVPKQLESARIAAAAILDYLKADPIMFTFHKEYGTRPPGWPGRKVDPHTLKIGTERANVTAIMEDMMARFKDVPEGHTHYNGVEWLAENGITGGTNPKDDPPNTLFSPNRNVTRAEFATMLKRYHDKLGK